MLPEKEDYRESLAVMEKVKLEPLDFDSAHQNECSNKRIRLEASNTLIPLTSEVAMKDVKVEAPGYDSGGNRGIRRSSRKRPHSEVSNTPKKLKSSLVKKKTNRTSRRFLKKKRMRIDRPSKSVRKKVKSSHMDETYEAFLNLALMSGDQMIYTLKNCRRFIYEKDMQSASDSEDCNRCDGYRSSCVKTKAATNRASGKGVMKKNMSCPKNYQDTSAGSDRNEHDSHQPDQYSASHASEYEVFITFLEVAGKNLVYTPSNGAEKIYEEVETTSGAATNAETNAMHRDPLDTFHTGKGTWPEIKSHNLFREGLMKDLKRPYNQEEYVKLLETWCDQGPSHHETDLSNGMESCQTPREYGKSYLHVHKDLAAKINAANGDHPRTLSLLRGLFYWEKNKSKEGSFIPWKNKRCLKALPQPEEDRVTPATDGSPRVKSEM
ncbi:uncharacterized protein LOC126783572 isoform X2 [Argentina anserina]|uniref:uncharacterized protein LOC126783572 isoform X2 n=1 Tax=Argentina anserina TaxID=57926 RepID=UPI00217653EF|nr:uncharacterized protein LOC126783572 isoform X2 [Potentilla anserina]